MPAPFTFADAVEILKPRPAAEGDFLCTECGEVVDTGPNVEAFELSGIACCDLCAEEIVEANGQFGVGA